MDALRLVQSRSGPQRYRQTEQGIRHLCCVSSVQILWEPGWYDILVQRIEFSTCDSFK